MNELLQQRIEAVQIGRNTTFAQMEQKKSLRDQLESDVAAFLAKGGVVTSLNGTEYKERPPRVIHGNDEPYVTLHQQDGIRRWANVDYSMRRRNALADHTNISLSRVRTLLTGPSNRCRMTPEEYKQIKAVMIVIEAKEFRNEAK